MCGIAGALGQLGEDAAGAILRSLDHRGPDGEGQWRGTTPGGVPIWLGHRRLSIIDLSPGGAQPMVSDCGASALVFNGEIYNYRELRQDLGRRGVRLHGDSDTEVLLRLMELDGEQCLPKLRGMFAFAFFDRRTGRLVLARDAFGEKPLYFSSTRDGLVFASEIRSILASGWVERELDSVGLSEFLRFGAAMDPHTVVRGVQAVLPGQFVVVDSTGHAACRFFTPFGVLPVAAERRHEVETLHDALRTAVRRTLVADVPVAVLLSGGVDSSSNVVMLAEQGIRPHTFSVVFGGTADRVDERAFSRLMAQQFGTDHHEVVITPADAESAVSTAVHAMDSPSHDGVNTFLVCRAVKQAGFKVAVSGQGSDELFLGYDQRKLFPAMLRLSRIVPQFGRKALQQLAGCAGGTRRVSKVFDVLSSEDAEMGAYVGLHSIFSAAEIAALRGRGGTTWRSTWRSTLSVEPIPPTLTPLDLLSRLEASVYLPNVLLRDGDQMSMASSVELRTPFLDLDLAQSVLRVGSRHKIERARNKPLLLDAVGTSLPREVWDRPKQGFALPYAKWLRSNPPLPKADATILGLDPDAVERVERDFFQRGAYWTRVWTLRVLTDWVRRNRLGCRWVS